MALMFISTRTAFFGETLQVLRSINMRFVFSLILSAFVASTMAQQDTYPTAYDNINIDMILQNERLFKPYLACILDEGRCPPEGATFKEALPDALKNNCAKCTDRQKEMVKKIGRHMINERPDEWALVSKKYDPDGQYATSFLQFIGQ